MHRNQQDSKLKGNHINIQIKEMGKRKKKKERENE
jgi:tRNA(Glu) U13 pseudouridine synthase TruD